MDDKPTRSPEPVPDPAERRSEPRLWCSELVEVVWKERGRVKRASAVLEDISRSGACVQLDAQVPQGAALRIEHPAQTFEGEVRYCIYRETGYFVGVRFREGQKWNEKVFRPEHLLDPAALREKVSGEPEDR